MKVVPKSVINKMRKYKTRRAKYRALYRKGYSQEAIANAYGVSKKTVWMAIHSWNKPKEKI